MKNYITILLPLTIVSLSACNNGQEKITLSHNATNQAQRHTSDTVVYHAYSKLSASLSGKLKLALEQNQKNWHNNIIENCSINSQISAQQCYTNANNNRLDILARHQTYLNNLINKKLSSLKETDGKYVGDFESYCMCGTIIPFVDLKNNMMVLGSACDELFVKHSIEKIVLSDDQVTFTMKNKRQSKYSLTFKYDKNQIYRINSNGDHGINQTVHFAPYLGNKDHYPMHLDSICGDFQG